MEKARIALIGAGWWGTYAHIPALQQHPQAELVAVQSRSREKADKIAAEFSPGDLRWYAMRVIEASSQSARLRANVALPAVER